MERRAALGGKVIVTYSRLIVIAVALTLTLSTGCAGRMTVDEFNREFDLAMPSRATIAEPLGDHHEDSAQARRFAARRYLEASGGMARMFDEILHEGARQIPEAQRSDFFRLAKRMFPPEEVEELIVGSLAKHFTRQQLDAMEGFYGTPAGRSIAARGFRTRGPPVPSEGPLDTPQDRRVAAQRYLFEVDGKRLYGELMRSMAPRLHPTKDELETFLWQANRDYPEFERQFLSQLETYNTRNEIEAWMRFHRSPDGRSMITQLPLVMDDFLTHLLNVMRREAQRIKEKRR